MGVDLSPAQHELLLGYLALLIKWNKAYNLTAVRDPRRNGLAPLARQPERDAVHRKRPLARRRQRRRDAWHSARYPVSRVASDLPGQ